MVSFGVTHSRCFLPFGKEEGEVVAIPVSLSRRCWGGVSD